MRSGIVFNIFRCIECIILAGFFGLVPALLFLLVTVVAVGVLFGTNAIEAWTLWSLVPAIAIDILLLKKWIVGAYRMNGKALASVYIFHSIIGLGMCMGIPLVSFSLGIGAGLYAARRMRIIHANEQIRRQYVKKTAIFSASVMALMCGFITLWAIAGQMIGYRMETPWLSFTFTVPIFFAIVLTGGAAAVMLQYLVTLIAAKLMSRLLSLSHAA